MNGSTVELDGVFDGRQAEPSAFFFGSVIGLKYLCLFIGWDARAIVGNGYFDALIRVALRANEHISPSVGERLAGILKHIDKRFRGVAALHQQRGKTGSVAAMDLNGVAGCGREDALDCM